MAAMAIGLSVVSSAHAAGAKLKLCQVDDWDEHAPVQQPQLQAGSVWTYVAGNGIPTTELTLLRQVAGENIYALSTGERRTELAMTYADRLPHRKGSMVLIRFPLKVRDTWDDRFEEEGEYRSQYEHYRYDYAEQARTHVLGVEDIHVAAGRFRAIHIFREASWTKSRPRAMSGSDEQLRRTGDASKISVSGSTITHFWYAPSIGRAVLKASMRLGSPAYAYGDRSLLDLANSSIVELQSYVGKGKKCADKPLLMARQPESYVPIGYPLIENDSWQWAFQMREHRPRQVD